MRRAYEVFDGIIVVPGAMGAWRVEAVKKAGLVSGDTITEDADLTIAVHRAGYSIRYQEDAKSHTEAPDTISGFLRQRFRWTFGMFQASWKHKRSILERKTVGFISIVDAIWYQLITSVIYPFFDIYLIVFLLRLGFSYATTGSAGDVDLSMQISAAYLIDHHVRIREHRDRNVLGAPVGMGPSAGRSLGPVRLSATSVSCLDQSHLRGLDGQAGGLEQARTDRDGSTGKLARQDQDSPGPRGANGMEYPPRSTM